MDPFAKYAKEFDSIVDSTWAFLKQKPDGSSVYLFLYERVHQFRHVLSHISKEDITQELACSWARLIRQYEQNDPPMTLRTYLIRLSPWFLRDWLIKEGRGTLIPLDVVTRKVGDEEDEVDLGPRFLLFGTDIYPYSTLTNYERLLLYLLFYEDRSVSAAAKRVRKHRRYVGRDVDRLLEYLEKVIPGDPS